MNMEFIPYKTLPICDVLNLLVNISINTTYKPPVLLIFRTLSKISKNVLVIEKKGFHIRIQKEKSYSNIGFLVFCFFLQASVTGISLWDVSKYWIRYTLYKWSGLAVIIMDQLKRKIIPSKQSSLSERLFPKSVKPAFSTISFENGQNARFAIWCSVQPKCRGIICVVTYCGQLIKY